MGLAGVEPGAAADRRRLWLAATLASTAAAYLVSYLLAPASGEANGPVLALVLFVGTSCHVAASAWFASVPDVRAEARRHPGRYVWMPLTLTVVTAVLAATTPPETFSWALVPFFAWQLFHFQKQNLGLAAIASVAFGGQSLRPIERHCLVAAGACGIVGVLARPALLRLTIDVPWAWLHGWAAAATALTLAIGVAVVLGRPRDRRQLPFVVVYLVGLAFFLPVFLTSSPIAAIGGLTVAHGLQYLLLLGLVAAGTGTRPGPVVSLAVLVNVALVGGLVLAWASHRHDGSPALRACYGAYLGLVMAHFVVDARLWRLRDPFPRAFLGARIPSLVTPPRT